MWDLVYLGVGLLNVAGAWVRRILMLRDGLSREGLVEAAFYLLLWPAQLLFWTFVGIHNLTGWILSRLMGEK